MIREPICVLPDLLERWVEERPDGCAVIDATGRLTYGELYERALAVAGGLCRRGVRPMDRVALLLPEGIELVVGLFACFRLGAVAVPLAFGDAPERRRYILGDCEPRLSLVATSAEGNGERAVLSELAAGPPLTESLPTPTDEDLAVLLYTAGASGPPKGVMHIHGRMARAALRHTACLGLSRSDVITTRLPCARASGLMGSLLPGMAVGAPVVIAKSTDPTSLAPLPEAYCATGLLGTPTDYEALTKLPDSPYDPGVLRLCLATGAQLPEAVSDAFRRRYGVTIRSAWGTTEVPYACIVRETIPGRPGSIGVPTPGVTIRLEDGELWLKSDVAPVGYWNNPAATAALLHDGWVHTGDRARMDADGQLYLVATPAAPPPPRDPPSPSGRSRP